MTLLLAIDPGYEQSAYVIFNGKCVTAGGIHENGDLLEWMHPRCTVLEGIRELAIEHVESYGMAVGREVFETVWWCGRFWQQWMDDRVPRGGCRVTRKDVKLHLCGNTRAKDANVRQALIDKFGRSRSEAIGTKKRRGPLYGVKSHMWSALAVAVTAWETKG